jgi:hypothetical protein
VRSIADAKLTTADVIDVLSEANAVGKLTIAGDNPVVVIGTDEDKERAREVLKDQGWTLISSTERDEWTSLGGNRLG